MRRREFDPLDPAASYPPMSCPFCFETDCFGCELFHRAYGEEQEPDDDDGDEHADD